MRLVFHGHTSQMGTNKPTKFFIYLFMVLNQTHNSSAATVAFSEAAWWQLRRACEESKLTLSAMPVWFPPAQVISIVLPPYSPSVMPTSSAGEV